jgi:hypothetical protein
MKPRTALLLPLFALAPLVGLADEPKLSCIKDVTYSQEFLAKYPKAGAACREVVMKDGQKWIRFDAHVVKVSGIEVTAELIDDFNNAVGKLTVSAAPDVAVDMNGKPTKYGQLKTGDELSFWVPESRWGFYAAPGTLNTGQFKVVNSSK